MAEPVRPDEEAADRPARPVPGESSDVTASTATTDDAAHGRHRAERERSGWGAALRELGIVVVAALVLSVVVRLFLVQAFFVPSASMENTLLPDDRILASKITTRFTGVHRGEVVVFRDPGGWLPPPPPKPGGVSGAIRSALEFVGLLPTDTGQDLVKRVIGIGGDRVQCCDAQGRIVLNGVPLDETYLKPGGGTDQVRFDVVVPADSMFVMGDNRGDSRDSRYHLEVDNGAVPTDQVVGRVFLVVWPFSRFSTVTIPDIYGNPALDRQGVGSDTSQEPSPAAPS
ncbi:MAG: signal peptidase I [Candidatus Nanopelagicales bacterium]